MKHGKQNRRFRQRFNAKASLYNEGYTISPLELKSASLLNRVLALCKCKTVIQKLKPEDYVTRLKSDDYVTYWIAWHLLLAVQSFIGWCDVSCPFWLPSRKDDFLDRVLRKSFWIKKFPFTCRIIFEKHFIKPQKTFFTRLHSLILALGGLGEFWKVMQTLTASRVCRTNLNSPSPLSL